jgi:hypothetical protein
MRHFSIATPVGSLLQLSALERANVALAAEWSRKLDVVPPHRRAGRMLELKDQFIEELRREGVTEAALQAHAIRVSITVYRIRMSRRRARVPEGGLSAEARGLRRGHGGGNTWNNSDGHHRPAE